MDFWRLNPTVGIFAHSVDWRDQGLWTNISIWSESIYWYHFFIQLVKSSNRQTQRVFESHYIYALPRIGINFHSLTLYEFREQG